MAVHLHPNNSQKQAPKTNLITGLVRHIAERDSETTESQYGDYVLGHRS